MFPRDHSFDWWQTLLETGVMWLRQTDRYACFCKHLDQGCSEWCLMAPTALPVRKERN